jgi:hypothetical protein
MIFLNPGAWMWAGLAVVIALLYLWRFSSTTHTTASFLLWEKALARRPAWVAWRFWLSLTAQVVLLLLMVTALTQPFWAADVNSRRTVVLLMDVSASMSASSSASCPFERMQVEARRIVENLQIGEQMAIIAVGSTAHTACRLTGEKESLLAAIDSLTPTDGTTNMKPAVRQAKRLLAGKPNPRTVVLTDGAFPGTAELASSKNVHVTVFRDEGQNVAITRFATRPESLDPAIHDVLVEVTNFTDQTQSCELALGIKGEAAISKPISIESGLSQQVLLPLPIPRPGVLEARLILGDDLTADNQVWTQVQRSYRPYVLLLSDESMAADAQIQATLESDPRRQVSRVERLPATLPENAACVFYGLAPSQLPACPMLVIDPREPCDLWEVAGTIDAPDSSVKNVDSVSPLLASVRFQDIVVERATRLIFKEPASVLAESSSGDALYSMIQRPTGRILVLHVNLEKNRSDLVMRPEFPILVDNALRWLCEENEQATFATTVTQTIPVTASDAVRILATPEGLKSTLAPHQSFAALDRVGLWTGTGGAADLELPINLLNRGESDLRVGSEVPSSELKMAAEIRQPLWMLLVFIALIGLSLEWCLHHRRITV